MSKVDEQAVWRAFQEHVSPLDENFETLSQWVRDGIADGTLAPAGVPSLVEKFKRVVAMHQQIAESQGEMKVTFDNSSPADDIKPMKVTL